jgi:hypothetical protein
LKHFRGAQNAVDPVLVQVGLSTVHEVEQDLEIVGSCAIQDDVELVVDGCVDGSVAEEGLEVGAACRQDQTMSFEDLT